MYGIYFSYKDSSKQHLIETFETEKEAILTKDKYVIDKGEKVEVKPVELLKQTS